MPRHRWVRRIALGLLAVLVVAVAGAFYFRHVTRQAGTERLAAIAARLDATEPRWRLDEIEADRGVLSDDQNAALLVPRFKAALATKEFAVVRPGPTKRSVFDDLPPNRVLDEEGAAALEEALEGNDAALAVARSFKDHPRGLRRYAYTPDFIGTLLPDLQETRQVVAILDAEAERLCRDGRPGAALHLTWAMLNVARSVDGEPFLVSCLVRIACDAITVRRVERTLGLSVPKGDLANLTVALLREADADLFWVGLRGERAGMDLLLTSLRAGRVPITMLRVLGGGGGGATPTAEDHIRHWAREPFLPGDHATYLETITQVHDVRWLPENQQRAALRAIPVPPDQPGTSLTHLLLPAVGKVHDASLRAKALLRCAAVGLAAEQFRRARGRWPTSLDEIPKGMLAAVPLDPFDGKPLKYVRRADGVTVYSIGVDERDDGGTIIDRPRPTDPGTDIGFRLYDPDARGLSLLARAELPPGRGGWPEPDVEGNDAGPGPAPAPRVVGRSKPGPIP